MELFLNLITVVAIIPAVLFLYAHLSSLIQNLTNKSFDEVLFDLKWQLNTYASYSIIIASAAYWINAWIVENDSLGYAFWWIIIASYYVYLYNLISYNGKKFFNKLP